MELAEAPFSDPEAMNAILLVLFVILAVWAVVTFGGAVAGWRAGRDPTRRRALGFWAVAVAIQSVVAFPVLVMGGVEALWWLLPLAGTALSYPLGRAAGPPRRDMEHWDARLD
jgi:hypothetical protein